MSITEKPSQEMINQPSSAGAGQARIIRLLTMIVGVITAVTAVGLLILVVENPSWQLRVLVLAYAACTGFTILAANKLYPQRQMFIGIGGTGLVLSLAMLATSALITGLGFPAAVIYLIFALMVSASVLTEWQADLTITIGILISGLCVLLTDFSPFTQLSLALNNILIPLVLGLVVLTYIVMLARQFITATLRIRLVSALLAIVMVPLTLLPTIQSRFMFNVLDDKINQSLLQSAQQTAIGIDKFLEDQQLSVSKAAELEAFVRYLELPKDLRSGSPEEQEIALALRILDTQEVSSSEVLSSFALLDLEGNNLFDTLVDRSGGKLPAETMRILGPSSYSAGYGIKASEIDQDFFLVPARAGVPYISPVLLPTSSRGFFYISAPVKNAQKQTLGVLRVRYDGLLLQNLLLRFQGLVGEESYSVLLDENNIRLGDTFTPDFLYQSVALLSESKAKILKENLRLPELPDHLLATDFEVFDLALYNYESQPFFLTNINAIQAGEEPIEEIGAITRIKTMPWKVVYLQANFSNEALRRDQQRLTTLLTALVAVVVGFIAIGAAWLLSRPILRLTVVARQISEGDLTARAPVQSSDEFGLLGAAFNSMTSQLRALIDQLEERVHARTLEIEEQNQSLSHRARQLETVSEVARQIVSTQELEALLTSVAHMISERFGFYHVGIFLLDDNNEYAVLRAANSEGGQRMLARHHMLPVGRVGIVGTATGTGQAHIATDVGEDAVFFNNPDLPETRSEMALPLLLGDTIIGALDIQSTVPDAFNSEDIDLFKTLADQVAIAIHNNRLYENTLQALQEAESLHRQYLQSEWGRDTSHRKVLGYVYNQSGISPQTIENSLWKKVFTTGEPVYAVLPNNGSADKALMAVPIAVRGETIGVIQVQDQGEARFWSEDEITVVNSIASQVAVALENARLFETTVRRAEREKKVLEITARIRSTNNPEEMMKIAVSEVQQALRATRTQIYIRQTGEGANQETDKNEVDSSSLGSST